ncbi:MAG: hypothetical protein ABSG69_08915 [Candidatus Acidiferrum sp.]|jgi:uncharacterized protein
MRNSASRDRELRGIVSRSGDVAIGPQTGQLFDRAFALYQKRSDKSGSLTECTSFIIMDEQPLAAALTHDRHFVQAGFEAPLRQSYPLGFCVSGVALASEFQLRRVSSATQPLR